MNVEGRRFYVRSQNRSKRNVKYDGETGLAQKKHVDRVLMDSEGLLASQNRAKTFKKRYRHGIEIQSSFEGFLERDLIGQEAPRRANAARKRSARGAQTFGSQMG